MKKTKIVALDIGGVCVHLQPEKALAYFNLSNLPARSLQLFDQLERGQLAENDFITQAAALLPETVSAEKFMTGWAMIIGEAMEGMNELVEEFSHKRGVEFVFLSDISTFHLRVIRERFYSEQFISNGIYSSPTLFKFAKGGKFGVMGEAGPEAVMPLRRGPDGSLGVRADGIGGGSPVVVNVINNSNAQARTERRQTAQGTEIDVLIDEMVGEKIGRPGTSSNNALRAYNNRQLIMR